MMVSHTPRTPFPDVPPSPPCPAKACSIPLPPSPTFPPVSARGSPPVFSPPSAQTARESGVSGTSEWDGATLVSSVSSEPRSSRSSLSESLSDSRPAASAVISGRAAPSVIEPDLPTLSGSAPLPDLPPRSSSLPDTQPAQPAQPALPQRSSSLPALPPPAPMSKFGSTSIVTVTTPLQAIVEGREIASPSASTGLDPSLASYALGPLQVIEERTEPNTADTSLDTSLDTIDVSLLSNPFGEDEVVSGAAGGAGVKEQQEQQEQQEVEEEHEEHEADVTGATFGDTTLDSVYSQESRASSVYRRSEVLLRGVLGRGDGLRPPTSPAPAAAPDTVTPTPAGETELVGPEPASGVEGVRAGSGVAVGERGREEVEQTGKGEGKGELQGEKKGEAGRSKAQAAEAGEQQRDVSPLQPLAKREEEDLPGCSCERWPCSAQ